MAKNSNYQSFKVEVIKALEGKEKETLEAIGEFLKEEARKNAPERTGKYKESIDFKVDDKGKSVELGSFDFKANWIEKGTRKTKAHNTLSNAAENNISEIKKIAQGGLQIG